MENSKFQYLPGDHRLIDIIVNQLKSQGIFDQWRKDCLSDVDTKPAYQNLHQRVERSVSNFLSKQVWKPSLVKNQVRDNLRKHILDLGMIEKGVERIVEQVVNPKVVPTFRPTIEDMVYNFLGMEKPARKPEPPKVEEKDIPPSPPPDDPPKNELSIAPIELEPIVSSPDVEEEFSSNPGTPTRPPGVDDSDDDGKNSLNNSKHSPVSMDVDMEQVSPSNLTPSPSNSSPSSSSFPADELPPGVSPPYARRDSPERIPSSLKKDNRRSPPEEEDKEESLSPISQSSEENSRAETKNSLSSISSDEDVYKDKEDAEKSTSEEDEANVGRKIIKEELPEAVEAAPQPVKEEGKEVKSVEAAEYVEKEDMEEVSSVEEGEWDDEDKEMVAEEDLLSPKWSPLRRDPLVEEHREGKEEKKGEKEKKDEKSIDDHASEHTSAKRRDRSHDRDDEGGSTSPDKSRRSKESTSKSSSSRTDHSDKDRGHRSRHDSKHRSHSSSKDKHRSKDHRGKSDKPDKSKDKDHKSSKRDKERDRHAKDKDKRHRSHSSSQKRKDSERESDKVKDKKEVAEKSESSSSPSSSSSTKTIIKPKVATNFKEMLKVMRERKRIAALANKEAEPKISNGVRALPAPPEATPLLLVWLQKHDHEDNREDDDFADIEVSSVSSVDSLEEEILLEDVELDAELESWVKVTGGKVVREGEFVARSGEKKAGTKRKAEEMEGLATPTIPEDGKRRRKANPRYQDQNFVNDNNYDVLSEESSSSAEDLGLAKVAKMNNNDESSEEGKAFGQIESKILLENLPPSPDSDPPDEKPKLVEPTPRRVAR
nr:EOG090X0B7I [Triops cancriformis]